jgi:hypothetical protein
VLPIGQILPEPILEVKTIEVVVVLGLGTIV